MPKRDVVVVGASAGGLKALRQMLAYLPGDLRAAVLVVTHLAPTVPSKVGAMLAGAGPLPVVAAADGMALTDGRICTAVPDRHLVVGDDDVLRLSRGPRENRARPAIDALFRSAARWCGSRVIGVVLSGSLDDGAVGLAAIVECGGVALVQQPQDAMFDGMPRADRRGPGAGQRAVQVDRSAIAGRGRGDGGRLRGGARRCGRVADQALGDARGQAGHEGEAIVRVAGHTDGQGVLIDTVDHPRACVRGRRCDSGGCPPSSRRQSYR